MTKSMKNEKPVVLTVVAQIVAMMNEMKDKPMAVTVEALATKILAKNGNPIGAARARAYYRDLVNQELAPGKVERVVKAKAPKAPKVKATKAPADRKEALKAAAKRAGIHKDSVKEAKGEVESTPAGDDPLNLASPESLSFDDLKNLL